MAMELTVLSRSSAVAVIADRTAYVWNSRFQSEYLLAYSFKLKSSFHAGELF